MSHTTGRRHDIGFRAATTLFGHQGIEWDLTRASDADKQALRTWIEAYKALRPLVHAGRVVHGDHPDPATWVTGVVTDERAVYQVAQVATSVTARSLAVRLPGLDPATRYRVRPLAPADATPGPTHTDLPWLVACGIEVPGSVLTRAGIAVPTTYPDRIVMLDVERV